MTVQGQAVCEEDDDDMPPLEIVGGMSTPAAAKTASPPAAPEDDDDDDMPPLDYVGLTPAKKEEEKKPAVAPAADDEDDMPPLEYVGTEAAHTYSFREGSKVRLHGLSKADLNGQTGTVLPFLSTTKDRLPVRLDSTGKNVSIKPDNLESVAAAGPEMTPEPKTADEDSDDSMPPLEAEVAPAKKEAEPPAPEPAAAPAPEEDDDDEMPPLDYVGSGPAPQQAATAESKAAPAPPEADDDDDEMPPLEDMGTSPAAPEAFKEGDKVVLKGLMKADLNGKRGILMAFTGPSQERLPVKLDASGERVAIKPANLERLAESAAAPPRQEQAAAVPEQPEEDDEMPPLEHVGTAAPRPAAAQPEEEDDDMPPLEFVGGSPPAQPKAAAPPPAADDDEDDMPPLEFVGVSATAPQEENDVPPLEEEDDEMPPLETSSAPQAAPKAVPKAAPEEADDDMPPLEYVGTSPSATVSFKEGDRVVLKGLSKADLNGKHGTVMNFAGASKDRLPICLDATKQRVAIKPENLELAPAAGAPKAAPVEEDDDDMPPLDYVGVQPAAQAAKPAKARGADSDSGDSMPPLEFAGTSAPECTGPPAVSPETAAADDDDDMPPLEFVGVSGAGAQPPPAPAQDAGDDDDMPPLEYVGTAAAPTPAPAAAGFKEGDAVVLKGLSKADLNGQRGTVLAFSDASQGGRLPVRLQASGQKVSIKPENLEKAPAVAAPAPAAAAPAEDSEDDMPPLEYAGVAPEPAKQAVAEEEDDDDMPPLEYAGVAAGNVGFKAGEAVRLRGLSKAELNGQLGTVLTAFDSGSGRLPVRLRSSGEKVSIKPENLEKEPVPAAGDDDDDDDMPPLEYAGIPQPAPAPTTGTGGAPADDGEASDDSMPPLDYVGAAASPVKEPPPAAAAAAAPVAKAPAAAGAAQPSPEADFRIGDVVELGGLRTGNLNGSRAKISQEIDTASSRVQVRLETGKKLLVKVANVKKVPQSAPLKTAPANDERAKRTAPAGTAAAGAARAGAAPEKRVVTRDPEVLMEQLRQALASGALADIQEAVADVEAAEPVEWGDLLMRKKMLLKKLRARKRRLTSDETPAAPETPERPAPASPAPKAKAELRKVNSDSSAQSEKDWVVLGGAAAKPSAPAGAPAGGLVSTPSGPKAAPPPPAEGSAKAGASPSKPTLGSLRQWCEELQLPADFAAALEAEEVADPQELTGVADEELAALAKDLKIGPKGRFMKAVRRMKAAEQAELGSTCGSIA